MIEREKLTFFGGDINDEIKEWLDFQGFSHITGDVCSYMKYENNIIWAVVNKKRDFDYVVGQEWLDVFIHYDYSLFDGVISEETQEKLKQICIYHSLNYIFTTLMCDGVYSKMLQSELPTKEIPRIINDSYHRQLDERNILGEPFVVWEYNKDEWDTNHKNFIRIR